MLNGTGDSTRNINFGAHRHAGLSDLQIVIAETGIDRRTTGTDLAVKFLGKLAQQVEILFRTHTITAGYHYGSTFQIIFCLFDVTFKDLNHIVFGLHKGVNVLINHLPRVVLIEHLGFHHSGTHRGHLRAVIGVDDRGNDVSTEGRTDLIEEVFVTLLVLFVLIISDFQGGAIGGEPACERGTDTRTEITTDRRRTHQTDLRLFAFKQTNQNGRMRTRGIGRETGRVENMEYVNTVGEDLRFDLTFHTVSGHDGFQFHAQFRG